MSQVKNILIISKYFYPYESGSEKTTRYIIDNLIEKNYKIVLLSFKGNRERLNEKAVFYSLGRFKRIYDFFEKKKFFKEFFDIFFGALIIFKIILKEKTDLINIHYAESIMLPAVFIGKLFSKKTVILWPTSSVYHLKNYDKRVNYFISKISSKLADRFIAKGMDVDEIKKIFKISSNKLFLTPNPVEYKDYEVELNDFNGKLGIYYLGKYNGFKRPDILIEAVGMMKKENLKKIEVSFYGEGDYREKMEKLVKKLALENIIKIYSPVKNVKEVISKNHVFVYPSPFEPAFAQSILESFSSGRIVICKRTKSMERFFDEKSYIGIKRMDPLSLSKQLDMVVENYDSLKYLGMNAKKIIIEKFNFNYFISLLEELFQR